MNEAGAAHSPPACLIEKQVFWLLAPFTLLTLAFGGVIVPKLNL